MKNRDILKKKDRFMGHPATFLIKIIKLKQKIRKETSNCPNQESFPSKVEWKRNSNWKNLFSNISLSDSFVSSIFVSPKECQERFSKI